MRFRTYLGIVGVGLASLIGGCNTTPEQQRKAEERMLMLGLGYGSIIEPNPQRAAAMGLTSQIMRDYDVAREGRSGVNITIQQNSLDNTKELSEEEREEVMDRIFKKYRLGKYAKAKELSEEEREEVMDRIFKKYGLGQYAEENKKEN